MAIVIFEDGHIYADHVYEQERPEFSPLLGPDGNPLRYKKQRMGFDLTSSVASEAASNSAPPHIPSDRR
jgi:hypothetical protein